LGVTDKTRKPTDGGRCTDPSAEPSTLPPQPFEQLSLGATVTGPGSRTEDHYERGAKLKIKGERGVFTYRYASVSQAGLVSLHLAGADGSRAVRPEQVVPVRKKRVTL
jgi:hypothetical protein